MFLLPSSFLFLSDEAEGWTVSLEYGQLSYAAADFVGIVLCCFAGGATNKQVPHFM